MSPLLLGAISIIIIVAVFLIIGNKKDIISWLMVFLGIVGIGLVVLHFSELNHLVVTWLVAHPFFYALLPKK
ncbi:hypothetical protein KDA_18940 [Dictyobacter alpinus]|uniref:Uncharacterized protein n=1 Tax=Dictyobacter alpinus TaxID=2014873 RepID=A0A402B4Z0_9CHLR|nr:hypothetical protein [Dictyobacter alpinus]GCE26410.1 hypothetical protein KDA_18940 [Dictyobacter alpinus]